jgi:hypothetical protein
MDALGIECQVQTGIEQYSPEHSKLVLDFIKKHFGMK